MSVTTRSAAANFTEVVIGDVDGEVGQLAVRSAQHAVLVVPEYGRPEPHGAVVLVGQLALGKRLDRALGQSRVADVPLLGRPHVEDDAVLLQHPALFVHQPLDGVAAQPIKLRRIAFPCDLDRAPLVEVMPSKVDQVLARVAVLGQARV